MHGLERPLFTIRFATSHIVRFIIGDYGVIASVTTIQSGNHVGSYGRDTFEETPH